MLCKEFKLDPMKDGVLICHSEGYKRGVASNHADVTHWWPKHGKTMDDFRTDVNQIMQSNASAPPPAPALLPAHDNTAIPDAPGSTALAAEHAAAIIYANEGSYGSVNRNDNGALSVGKMQWHGSRALSLLHTVSITNLMQARNVLGMALYNEIIGGKANAWDKRVATADESKSISALLVTAEGKAAQDALAASDITAYIKKGQSYGLTDTGALIYFADGVNQYGTNAVLWKNIAADALEADGGVTAMFNATKARTTEYIIRRERVYKAVLALNLDGGCPTREKTPEEITVDAAVSNGILSDRAYWLGVLSGAVIPDKMFVKALLDNAVKKISRG
jgi:hypothetical protein